MSAMRSLIVLILALVVFGWVACVGPLDIVATTRGCDMAASPAEIKGRYPSGFT